MTFRAQSPHNCRPHERGAREQNALLSEIYSDQDANGLLSGIRNGLLISAPLWVAIIGLCLYMFS